MGRSWTNNTVLHLAVVCGLMAGCSRPPAVEFENLHLVASLRTACSAKSEPWLEGVARAVEARHAEGRMSDQERRHFVRIVERARQGEWEAADKACLTFEKAQLSRARTRPASNDSHHHLDQHADQGQVEGLPQMAQD